MSTSTTASASNEIALRLEHVSRLFGDVRAVDDLSLDVPSGAFVTLLGPSGCGKSTTLNMIAGLDQLDGGRILLGEEDITDTPPNERRMAMVFQNYALYPHMTAGDNIVFGLKLQRRPKAEVRARLEAVAEALDIGHLLDRKPGPVVRWPAAAGSARSSDGQGTAGLSARRAIQQPRRRPAQSDADRGQAPPPAAGDDQHLRDPRSGGGDDAVRPHRGHASRQGRAARLEPGDLPQATGPVRGDLRRKTQDEHR